LDIGDKVGIAFGKHFFKKESFTKEILCFIYNGKKSFLSLFTWFVLSMLIYSSTIEKASHGVVMSIFLCEKK